MRMLGRLRAPFAPMSNITLRTRARAFLDRVSLIGAVLQELCAAKLVS